MNKNRFFSVLDGYKRLEETACSITYGFYDTITNAKFACSSDIKCLAVHNEDCDDNRWAALCRVGVATETSSSSCLYTKDASSGKYCFFPTEYYILL